MKIFNEIFVHYVKTIFLYKNKAWTFKNSDILFFKQYECIFMIVYSKLYRI